MTEEHAVSVKLVIGQSSAHNLHSMDKSLPPTGSALLTVCN